MSNSYSTAQGKSSVATFEEEGVPDILLSSARVSRMRRDPVGACGVSMNTRPCEAELLAAIMHTGGSAYPFPLVGLLIWRACLQYGRLRSNRDNSAASSTRSLIRHGRKSCTSHEDRHPNSYSTPRRGDRANLSFARSCRSSWGSSTVRSHLIHLGLAGGREINIGRRHPRPSQKASSRMFAPPALFDQAS